MSFHTLALTGTVAFTIASLAIGLRLALLAGRTRELPEALISISFLTAGFGSNFLTLGWRLVDVPESWNLIISLTIRALLAIGAAAIVLVTWRVFRATSAWARALSIGCFTLLAVYVLRRWLIDTLAPAELIRSPFFYLESLAMLVPYCWFSWESLHHRSLLLRRRRLGLETEPGLLHRLLLWGVGMGSIAVLFLALRLDPILHQVLGISLPTPIIVAVLSLVCAACLWLAFFPPRRWRSDAGESAEEAAGG